MGGEGEGDAMLTCRGRGIQCYGELRKGRSGESKGGVTEWRGRRGNTEKRGKKS